MKIELLKPHTHAGQKKRPGDTITLDNDIAAWLIQAGIAKAAPATLITKPLKGD